MLGGVDIGEHGAVEVIFNKAGTLAYTSQMETAKCFEIDVKTRPPKDLRAEVAGLFRDVHPLVAFLRDASRLERPR